MAINVDITGIPEIRRAFRAYAKAFDPTKSQAKVLFGRLGRAGRDLVRRNITSQGEGSYAPLSKWTMARTGRRKALITERSRVKFRVKPRRVEIVYEPKSSEWNLTSHHKGFTTKGFTGKKITIPLKQPGRLKIKGKAITIRSAKPSVVPARNVWTSESKIIGMAAPIASKWTLEILAKKGKA